MSGNNRHPIYKSEVSRSIPFDNSTNGFISTEAQSAIEEVQHNVDISSSPSFTYGRSGNLPNNTWLLNDTVPSNKSGRINYLNNANIVRVFVANEDPNIIKIGIYTHDGDEVNLTLLTTLTTAAQRSNTFSLTQAVITGKQIAIKIESDSANNGKNMDVGLMLKGTI